MSQSAKSVFYFGVYLVVLGVILILLPNFLLGLFGITSTNEVWIRVVGVLVLAISAYYLTGAKSENTTLLKTTVYVRLSIIFFFTGFVIAGWVQPQLILFGAVDMLGAIWTYLALRKEGKLAS